MVDTQVLGTCALQRESSSLSSRTITKDSSMDYYNKFKKDAREAIISFVDDEYLMCSFFEDNQIVGRIEYPSKSRDYVVDAAHNWISCVMTQETVKNYTKQLDLFTK